jgi:ArsR family transcriptional regulator
MIMHLNGRETQTVIRAQRFFACLSDEVRLGAMLLSHRHGELCVCELVTALDQNQSTVSRHLAQLRNCNLLIDDRRGQWVFYRLHPDFPPWALRVLEQAAEAEEPWLQRLEQRLDAMNNRPQRVQAHA